MSTLRVTAERLTIHPHDNADALELAQVGLYRAVVAKGQYKTGDWALYIPEGSLLPDALIEELGLTGKLAGSAKNRVKAVRLRGELSQGIVCRPSLVNGTDLAAAHAEDRDFATDLGVTKWVPPIPVHMAGEMVAAPDLVPWIDIEDVKRYPALFEPGEPVVATEKIHGTACAFTLTPTDAYVSSKGFSAKRLAIKHNPSNLYWRAVETHGVPEAAARIADRLNVERVAVFGEVFGQGVQDLAYGANGKGERPGYAVFDVAVSTDSGIRWLNPSELTEILTTVGLPSVPVLYSGPYDTDTLMALANGRETVSGKDAHLREGLVVRTATDRYSPITGGRAIGKFVSPAYLTRKGGTEYE
ncbi:RNA ligase (ATP) [Actinomadura rudentiformis]|uniref:RNA ligase (ATP) n=1 Tax=Actinomadura rudentiformis TaxID=359158 RepID=A0A6H9Z4U0_9ACTN|nr:RNA ligase (ATP) [Actinomadura rudentiformis]KAB2348512.1 RNA ligase (ATP) [Actinomadura rudentiformis]